MTALRVNATWLEALRASSQRPPLRPRVPLLAQIAGQEHQIGAVEPDLFKRIGLEALWIKHGTLLKQEHSGEPAWVLRGDLQAILTALGLSLRSAHMAGAWRGEALAVYGDTGQKLASIERAAVRPLAISTYAVHLVGLVGPPGAGQQVWVQQRSLSKANDPGQWDTLMGGMISAFDTLERALERETWEEAGLKLQQVQELRLGGRISQSRPTREAGHGMGGMGYLLEEIVWYRCQVPEGLEPHNQDGEVQAFALLPQLELVEMLEGDMFTPEAALILVEALGLAPG